MPVYLWGLLASAAGLILLLVYVEITYRKQAEQIMKTRRTTRRSGARKKAASSR